MSSATRVDVCALQFVNNLFGGGGGISQVGLHGSWHRMQANVTVVRKPRQIYNCSGVLNMEFDIFRLISHFNETFKQNVRRTGGPCRH